MRWMSANRFIIGANLMAGSLTAFYPFSQAPEVGPFHETTLYQEKKSMILSLFPHSDTLPCCDLPRNLVVHVGCVGCEVSSRFAAAAAQLTLPACPLPRCSVA